METGQVIRHGAFVAAVLKGFPADLNWTTGNPDPRDSLLVVNGGNHYYFVSPLHFRSAWIRLQAELERLKGLMSETDLLFQLPLTQGEKFCGADVINRIENASMFCWHVGPELPIDLEHAKGVPAGKRSSYEIHYLTVVDETEVQIVPGIGITRYECHRHTSPADAVLNLTEFQSAAQKPHGPPNLCSRILEFVSSGLRSRIRPNLCTDYFAGNDDFRAPVHLTSLPRVIASRGNGGPEAHGRNRGGSSPCWTR